MRILMVCLGNICRSPLAEGILRHKITQKGLDWEVDSAGTSGYHEGERPDSRSIAVARSYGIDITAQRSRMITLQDLEDFDWILVMDSSNYNNVKKLCRSAEQLHKIKLIMNYVNPDYNTPVPDPYWEDDGFDQVYRMLDVACDALVAKHTQEI